MHIPALGQIRDALRTLNPDEVREMAEKPITFGILAADLGAAEAMTATLAPGEITSHQRAEAERRMMRVLAEEDFSRANVGFAEAGVPHPAHFYVFDELHPDVAVNALLDENEDLWLPLGRWFPGIRPEVTERIVRKVCRENALFTVATAIPNVLPSWLVLPWAAGEFASDTAFLTVNQVRMSFLLAGVYDRPIGYAEQKGQIGSIIAAAFGWRALARELAGKIPLGGGLVAKGLISFAGTYAVGKSLERYILFGQPLNRSQRRLAFDRAVEFGRTIVEDLVEQVRGRVSAAKNNA